MKTGAWLSSFIVLALAGSASAQQPGKKFQCWTDDKGVKMCGDQVPPQYAGKERAIRNEKGVVVDSKAAAETPEERAAKATAEEQKAKEAEEQKKKDDYDHSLLEDYRTVGDLQAKRKETVGLIKARIRAAERIKSDNENALKGQQDLAEQQQKKGKPVDDINKRIARLQKDVASNEKSLDRMHKELDSQTEHFGKDLARYCELKSIPKDKCDVEPPTPPPPATPPPKK